MNQFKAFIEIKKNKEKVKKRRTSSLKKKYKL